MKEELWKRVPWHIGEETRKELEEVCQDLGMTQLERCSDKVLKCSIELIKAGDDVCGEIRRYEFAGINVISSSFLLYRILRSNGRIDNDEIVRVVSATISSMQEESKVSKERLYIGLVSILVRLFTNLQVSVENNVLRGNLTSIDDETAEGLINLVEKVAKEIGVLDNIERKGGFFKVTLKSPEQGTT